MTSSKKLSGYFRGGLPYNRLGNGPRTLVAFQGLMFENKPVSGFLSSFITGMFKFLGTEYTVYVVTRKPGLPMGYSMRDMSDDYATMIEEEFGQPVDVIGTSTGGSIAQHFGADHADLIRKLIIHSSAHRLGAVAKELQLEIARLASQRKWRESYAVFLRTVAPKNIVGEALVWVGASFMALSVPKDPTDLVVTVEAEDKHAFKERLGEITSPTLVVAGANDPFYTEALFRETAAGIPHSQLIVYPGMGHPAGGKQFERDVLAFLKEDPVR